MAKLRPELLKQFSPAFLGRLTLVPYYHLGDEQIRSIVELKLGKLAGRFSTNHKAAFSWDPQVADAITARCTEVDSGARNIDHILAHSVLPELSRQVLERISMAEAFDAVRMGMAEDGGFVYTFRTPELV